MGPLYCVLLCGLTALVALGVGYGGARLLDRFRFKSIRTQAEEIARTAREGAENVEILLGAAVGAMAMGAPD